MANFAGRWEDTGEMENFDEFVKAMKLPAEAIEVYRTLKHTYQYSINGDTWTMHVANSLGKERTYTCQTGKEFCDKGLDGKDIKFTMTVVNDNEFKEDFKVKMDDSWSEFKATRKVDGDTMTTSVTTNGQTMISKQRRLK